MFEENYAIEIMIPKKVLVVFSYFPVENVPLTKYVRIVTGSKYLFCFYVKIRPSCTTTVEEILKLQNL